MIKKNERRDLRAAWFRATVGVAALTVGVASVGMRAVAATEDTPPSGEAVAKGSDCFSCHAVDQKVVGPAFVDVATKFAGQADAPTTLSQAIKNGHVGTWGQVPMPPHPQLSDAQLSQIVSWILALKPQKAAAADTKATDEKKYTYTVQGQTVSTNFPIFQDGTTKVTPTVFRGYELFNSYCFRCHGADALGGSYAPNLRASLSNGMDEHGFLTVAMEGRKAKGMPSWASFFTPDDIRAIYQYVKARSVNVVDTGTPPQ